MWDIDKLSGHARHRNGGDAYFDAAASHGLEIPTIGPFGSQPIAAPDMADLIRLIESEYPDRYAVWGAEIATGNRSAKFMRLETTWVADYSFRTLLLHSLGQVEHVAREWEFEESGQFKHRSGPAFELENNVTVLLGSKGTDTMNTDTFMLAINLAYKLLCEPPLATAIG